MSPEAQKYPSLLKTAIGAVALAPVIALGATFLPLSSNFGRMLLFLAFSLLLFGVGEVLNHPEQKGYTHPNGANGKLRTTVHHHRNSCALGNLFLIGSLLLFFMSFAKLISP